MKHLIDLHMHSCYSNDGEFTPDELMRRCREAGIKSASLTDHNSVRGVGEAKQAGEKYDIHVTTGIELDCNLQGVNLHLLGYGIDITDPRYLQVENEVLKKEQLAAVQLMEAAYNLGLLFDDEKCMEFSHKGAVTGEIIAEVALTDERNKDNSILKPYRQGGERSDNAYVNFYWDYCSQGKPCYVPIQYMSFDEANNLIRESGGISVLAHPSITVKRDENRIQYMRKAGIGGIEVYSSYHTSADVEYYNGLAREYGLLKTIGSDYHGKTKPAISLGRDVLEEEQKLLTRIMAII